MYVVLMVKRKASATKRGRGEEKGRGGVSGKRVLVWRVLTWWRGSVSGNIDMKSTEQWDSLQRNDRLRFVMREGVSVGTRRP